jgi:hypothetical protein
MIFPVHAVAAAIQSIGVVRRDVERDTQCFLGRHVLLPAVLFHGTFDWILMFGDFVGQATTNLIVLALSTVLGAFGYYLVLAKRQRKRLTSRDQQASIDKSTLL